MLSALELNGFKSFADRTRFEFQAGITVVVGPNGSGKSNVVDAIKWVLGAQSVKSLRGKEMTDVIFGGSRARRQANAAEASLIFDNSAGAFDHDAAEIQITRRVYRSGEAEYLLNRQACRLRDLRDLLASGGISSGAYSIIEQGRVDAFLQATPKERRQLFEEAAGVSRFRTKRDEAARRLEKVQQNLLRLADIVEELESRLRSVRSQAGKAQKHSEISKRLEQLRTHLAVQDWRRLAIRADELNVKAKITDNDAVLAEQQLARCESSLSEIETLSDELQRDFREASNAESAVREQLAQCESLHSSHLARIDELDQEVQRSAHQLLLLTTRAGDSQQLLAETAGELSTSSEQYKLGEQQLLDRQQELAKVEASFNLAVEDASRARSDLERAEKEAARLARENQLFEVRVQSIEDSLARLEGEIKPLTHSRDKHASELKQASARLSQFARELDEANHQLAHARTSVAQDRSAHTALQKHLSELEGRLAGANERIAVLDELERRLEGLTSGTKQILQLARNEPNGPFRHVRGLVADLLHVDADTAPLIEIALGDRANFLVVSHTESLASALAAESDSWSGRTSFLRLDVPQPASAVDRIDLSAEPGVMGRADSFVEASEDLTPMVRRLLGRHWLVDSLVSALRLSNGPGRGLNFITVAGEVLLADGTLTVGPRHNIAGLLSRRSELRALREQIEEMRRTAVNSQREQLKLEERIESGEGEAHELAKRHAEAVQAHADARLKHSSITDKLAQIESRIADAIAARDLAASQLEELAASREQSTVGAAILQQQIGQWRAAINDAMRRQEAYQSQIVELRQALTEQRVQLARGEQRVDGLQRQLEQLQRDRAERDSLLEDTRRRAAECQAQKARLRQSVSDLAAEGAELLTKKEQLASRLAGLESRSIQLQEQRSASSAAVEAARQAVFARQRTLQRIQLELQQVEQERASLATRYKEDYSTELAVKAAEAPADPESAIQALGDSSREALEAEILDLRGRLQAAGPVNAEALAELEGLESRYGALAAQYQDLQAARERLERIVQQINGESRQLFLDAIADIRSHFQEIFGGLFVGGEADIVVEDDPGGDVLECGVSIIARPPGKQPRSISLLSGGERTLTCVALLLAIFRSRPSPFCVLDEVDAALDEANIDRFVGVLKQFMTSTQFIVITHSKRTMTCSDTLYGVTMQESGVSKRVSVRFEDVSEGGVIKPAALRAA
jgi:chromosome segregation protein